MHMTIWHHNPEDHGLNLHCCEIIAYGPEVALDN
jgi:hypothetical protein